MFPGVDVSGRAKWTGAVRARAGYAVDRFLPYLAGGVAFTKYKVVIDESGDIASDSQSLTGWTVGAGVEYAFTDQLMGRFEYRYTDFGEQRLFRGYRHRRPENPRLAYRHRIQILTVSAGPFWAGLANAYPRMAFRVPPRLWPHRQTMRLCSNPKLGHGV